MERAVTSSDDESQLDTLPDESHLSSDEAADDSSWIWWLASPPLEEKDCQSRR